MGYNPIIMLKPNLKLAQILALESKAKDGYKNLLNHVDRSGSNVGKTSGKLHQYRPFAEDDVELLPPEKTNVEVRYTELLRELKAGMPEYLDIVGAKDYTNVIACADVIVDGVTLVSKAPVPYLLFLEKQLTDLHTMISRMVEPDASENWKWDNDQEILVSEMTSTQRMVKKTVPLVLYPATDKHPAQTTTVEDTVLKGTWTKIKYSGAIPGTEKRKLIARIDSLLRAVKLAREEANSTKMNYNPIGEALVSFIFG